MQCAAEYLGCSVKTVRRHVTAGFIHVNETPGGLRRIDREELDALFHPEPPSANRGTVTEDEWRRYVRE